MKTNHRLINRFLALVLGIFSLLLASSAPAANLTWDANAGTAPNPSDGSGSWTTANNWWSGSANVTWAAANVAVFGAGTDGTYGINVSGLPYPAAQTIQFSNSGYTLTNATPLTIALSSTTGSTAPQLRILTGISATIGTNVTVQESGNDYVWIGQPSTTAAGTLTIENGGMVRNTNAAKTVLIDGVGTVVNVKTGGTLTHTGTGNQITTVGQTAGSSCTLNVQGGTVSSSGSGAGAGIAVGNQGVGVAYLTSGTITVGTGAALGLILGHVATGAGTFNLDGGTLNAPLVQKGAGTSGDFYFNGGTLKALANQTSFMTNLTSATVKSGGAIIDDGGFAITIGQPLLAGTPSGGLTKLGPGTLTLVGANTYTGVTTISNGTVKATSLGSGSVDVKAGAGLGAGSGNTAATLSLDSDLTLNSSVLLFDIASVVNADKIVVAGSLTPSGVTTILLSNVTPLANGDYTLLEVSGTLGGGATNFTVASQSPKTYAIVYQAGTPNRVLLRVTGPISSKTWLGDGVANQWNISSGLDWAETGSTVPLIGFQNNDVVVFDDTATNLTVDISATVSPASVTVNNTTNAYTFSGVGGIAGATVLTKNGTNQLTLAGANTYNGGTTLLGTGQLGLSNSAALGTGALNLKSAQTGATPTVFLSGGINVTNPIIMDPTTGREAFWMVAPSGNNTISGPITISAGTTVNHLYFENDGDAGSLFSVLNSISGPAFAGAISLRGLSGNFGLIAGQVTINSAFQINGAATWTISSTNNTWTQTLIQGANGSMILGANDALATGARLTFANNTSGYLDLAGYNQTVAGLDCAATPYSPSIGNSSTTSDSALKVNGGGYTYVGALVDVIGSGSKTLSVELLSGVQTLTGNNTYTGPTTLDDGSFLWLNGSLAAGSAVTVKSNATLAGNGTISGSVTVNSGGSLTAGNAAAAGNLTLGSLTLGAAPGDTQTISATPANNITVSGAVVHNGTTTIKVTSASNFSPGTYPLLTYTGDTITNGFVLGSLPVRVEGSLQYSTSSIDLVITSAVYDSARWTGATNGVWNTTTTNWVLNTAGTPTTYVDGNPGDAVIFDDTLIANSALTLNTTVSPGGMTFNNTATAYSVTGSGSIAGTGGLTKTGTNTVTLATTNSFTGTVGISDGNLVINNSAGLGAGTKTISVRSTFTVNSTKAELHLNGSGGAITLPANLTINGYCDQVSTSMIVNEAGDNIVEGPFNVVTGGGHLRVNVLSGSLTLKGNVTNLRSSGNKILFLDGTGINTVAGAIQNNPSGTPILLVTTSGGTWILNGTNTYTGGTSVAANSTLVVNGILGTTPVTVASGGYMKGNGTMAGAVVISAGGTLAPGTSVGTMTINNTLTLQGTNVMEIGRNGAALTNDLITGVTTLSYGGTLVVANVGSSPLQVGDSFQLFSATTYSGTFAIVYPDGYTFTNTLATNGRITVTSVPVTTPPNFPPGGVSLLPGGSISLTATGAMGGTYKLWASTNVALTPVTSTWTLLSNGTVTASPFTIIDNAATNYPQRFYLFSTP